MRTTRSSSVAPSTDEDAVSMTQVMDMMRTLQENVAASRSEQERMHEALVASQARNEELNRINEELRKALQEREERAVGDRSAPPSPPRSFPMPFSQEIMDSVVPANTMAVKASFTGVEDPEAHLTAFHTQMMLSGGSDAVYCKVFMSTLSGTALDWFVSLPTGHIKQGVPLMAHSDKGPAAEGDGSGGGKKGSKDAPSL